VVGRNLTVGGAGGTASQGRVTYGGTLTATGTLSTLGGLHQEQPPFDFSDQMALVRERSVQWADLKANGTIGGPGSYDVRFTGTSSTLNVFAVTATALQGNGKITINVPAGSTTLINVSGSSFTSALYGIDLVGTTPDKVLWNFPLATSVRQTSGLDFRGTILAPNAAVQVGNGNLYGQVLGAPGPRAARVVRRPRDPGIERRRAHAAAASDGQGPRSPDRGGTRPDHRRRAGLRRDRLEPGLVAEGALDGLEARGLHPAAHGRRRGRGGRRRLAHEALERGDDRGRLLGRGGRSHDSASSIAER
jgi:choice-of-anchor A domain-containing protein